MLYRILTENKNKPETLALVSTYFDGFTVIEATGYWKGCPEPSLIIEIDNPTDDSNILKLAVKIADQNGQEAVLIQSLENNSIFKGKQ